MRNCEISDRNPRRGLAEPVPGTAGVFTSLWGIRAKRPGSGF